MTKVRDRGARSRILEYLAVHGSVDDASGRATAVLKEAVGYSGSPVGFIQLVAAMERDGEITRIIRGKRTYGIASASPRVATVEVPSTPGTPLGVQIDLDYDRLARALLREVSRVMVGEASPPTGATNGEMAGVLADRNRLQAERDEYAARLEVARRQMKAILGEHLGAENPLTHSHESTSQEQAS